MIAAEINKTRNLLQVTHSGEVTADEARHGVVQLEGLLTQLQPGFRLLTDLTQLTKMDHECVPELKRMMDLCNQAGVSLVVRVIPDPHQDIGFNIMSLFHYRHGLRIVTCETMAEAENVLAR